MVPGPLGRLRISGFPSSPPVSTDPKSFVGGHYHQASAKGQELVAADLSGADARAADFSDANLAGAVFRETDLRAADLSHANLAGADLSTARVGLQTPAKIEGTAMNYTFDDASAEDRHTTQYFEMLGNRGIYKDGWTAVTKHKTPWETGSTEVIPLSDDVWELYDTNTDWSQAKDLAAEMPGKLAELQQVFMIEATKYNVLPIDDRAAERFNATIAGRPELQSGRTTQRFGQGMSHLTENTVLNVKNRSHVVSAQLQIPDGGANGVIIAQGGRFAGWSLYVIDGRLGYSHNWFSSEIYSVRASDPLPTGEVSLQYQFDFDGGHPGAGGTGTLLVNGEVAAEGRIDKTVPFMFSADETMDIGSDTASPVIDDYGEGPDNVFTGGIDWVQIDLEDDEVSHTEDPELTYHRIMARQ